MIRTAISAVCGACAIASLVACDRSAVNHDRGSLAQTYEIDAGGVPNPMPNSPLYDAGAAPLPSAVPSTAPGVPSPGAPPGAPPGSPTTPGSPSVPGQGPIVP